MYIDDILYMLDNKQLFAPMMIVLMCAAVTPAVAGWLPIAATGTPGGDYSAPIIMMQEDEPLHERTYLTEQQRWLL